jgi:hypothetical protein
MLVPERTGPTNGTNPILVLKEKKKSVIDASAKKNEQGKWQNKEKKSTPPPRTSSAPAGARPNSPTPSWPAGDRAQILLAECLQPKSQGGHERTRHTTRIYLG